MALLFRLSRSVFVMGMCLLVAACSSIYFLPTKQWVQNPARQELAYEDIVLIHPDGLRLHGWWLPAQSNAAQPVKGTVYFLHGNAQNISTHMMAVTWLPKQGYNVFMLDYRGFGYSEGKAKLPAVFEDIQLGLDWLSGSERLEGPLIVYGQSIGAAMSSHVLAQQKNQQNYQCAVLEAGFTSYRDAAADVMAQSWIKFFKPVVLPLLKNASPMQENVANITPPLLILHSQADEIIPYHHGEKNYQAAAEPKQMLTLKDAPHIGGNFSEEKQQGLLDFFNQQCVG